MTATPSETTGARTTLAVLTYCLAAGLLFWNAGRLSALRAPDAWVYLSGALILSVAGAAFEPARQALWRAGREQP